ncbi:MAG: hypothetical protein KatS3mg087_0039 [Patescibacteria group bacterium]|nr:MAG: hypothetical protein KatS3mg087_0039 [Patescibacteria group bacterium]
MDESLNSIVCIKEEITKKFNKVAQIKSTAKVALGLDLGLSLGYAYALFSPKELRWHIFSQAIGSLQLDKGKSETGFTAFLRLITFLDIINPSYVFYEEVRFTPDTKTYGGKSPAIVVARVATSAEIIGALRQTVLLWANEHEVPTVGIPIGEIKRVATGSGKATKEDIINACNERFGTNFGPHDSDAADAAFVLYSGLLKLSL